jgi:hypothetical protein
MVPNSLHNKNKSRKTKVQVIISIMLVLFFGVNTSCIYALDFNPIPFKSPSQQDQLFTRQQQPIQLKKKELTLEEQVDRVEMPVNFLQPVPLAGIRIAGLTAKSIAQLGQNYFVVIANSKFKSMYEVYRDNRLNNKPNYVTTDSIIHSYLAFTNRVYANFISKQLVKDLNELLAAMLKVAIADYQQAEDADVREDIERNIAFLSLASTLINPSFVPPRIGQVPELVSVDLKAIERGSKSESAIFSKEVDFSHFTPVGWYKTSNELKHFYQCREWLSRMEFPITDIATGTGNSRTNNFRRSVLLFRSLDLAEAQNKPALELWGKLAKYFGILGCQIENWQERTVYAQDYKSMFKSNANDLKVTLNSLAEPFYRTKLLLAIRRQKPVNLSSTSIFDLADRSSQADAPAIFRLFQITGEPEISWFRDIANIYPSDSLALSTFPLALIDMHVWGGGQANNILLDNVWSVDPLLVRRLVDLKKLVIRRLPGGQTEPIENRRWQMLSSYFRVFPEGIQSVLRSELWTSRRLESAFAAWLDGVVSLAPKSAISISSTSKAKSETKSETKSEVKSSTHSAQPVSPNRTKPISHYLEPDADMFLRLAVDARRLMSDSNITQYLDEAGKEHFNDFIRLFDRLAKIAQLEASGAPISFIDNKLLGNIDLILEKVDVPLPAILPIANNSVADADKSSHTGFTMALGNPGVLFIIMQNRQTLKWSLGRGAVYTYYEIPGTNLTESQWLKTLETSSMKQLPWTEQFDIIQSASVKTK